MSETNEASVQSVVVRCCLCNRVRKIAWYLDNYFGLGSRLDGATCQQCYEGVSHNAYGVALHPRRYRNALKRWLARNA